MSKAPTETETAKTEHSSPGRRGSLQKEPQPHRTAPNTVYRRAILQALDYSSVQNFNSRANIDWIRHHTKEILAEHEKPDVWNDAMFLQTLKSVVNSGEVELCANIQAELSPTYKRKRADSLQKKLEQHCLNAAKAPDTAPNLPEVHPHHVIFAFKDPKEPPHRPREHEKWKIIPKRVFDRTTIVNPMDTSNNN